jgi:altronate dehydratase
MGIDEIWKDITPEEREQLLANIDIEIDTKTGVIVMSSRTVNEKGEALYDWTLDSAEGQITEMKRDHEQVYDDVNAWKE